VSVNALKVVLFSTRARDCKSKLKEDGKTTEGQDAAYDPEKERNANRASDCEDA
jgi:hypothetical protein